jgi:hypothetical protein
MCCLKNNRKSDRITGIRPHRISARISGIRLSELPDMAKSMTGASLVPVAFHYYTQVVTLKLSLDIL